MLNEDELRASLHAAASAVPEADRAPGALALGRRQVRRRRVVAGASSLSLVLAGTAAATVVLSAAPTAPAAVADVVCGAHGATVRGAAVTAGPSGVPVRVTNTTGGFVRVLAGDEGAYVPPGTTRLQLALGPGEHDVRCSTSAAPGALDVVDVHHVWAAPVLPCAHPVVTDRSAEALVGQGDPLVLTESVLHASSVRLLGYRDATTHTVGVLEGGTVVATATWHPLLDGLVWTLGTVTACP